MAAASLAVMQMQVHALISRDGGKLNLAAGNSSSIHLALDILRVF